MRIKVGYEFVFQVEKPFGKNTLECFTVWTDEVPRAF